MASANTDVISHGELCEWQQSGGDVVIEKNLKQGRDTDTSPRKNPGKTRTAGRI